LGADILAIMHSTGARHLVGHSYGGLIGREAVLAVAGAELTSFTLMSSGPGALTGRRARDLRAMLAALGVTGDGSDGGDSGDGGDGGRVRPDKDALRAGIAELWRSRMEPEASAAGVPGDIVAFL